MVALPIWSGPTAVLRSSIVTSMLNDRAVTAASQPGIPVDLGLAEILFGYYSATT